METDHQVSRPRPEEWLARLPHRPPMRLVEEVLEVEPGTRARTARLARPGDWYFDGHFPGEPVVPAIVLVELLAQTGGLAAAEGDVGFRVAAFTGFKFPAAAVPGERLEAEARVAARMGGMVRIEGEVKAGGRLVAQGGVTLAATPGPRG